MWLLMWSSLGFADPQDEALDALLRGREGAAMSTLRASKSPEDACLLGLIELQRQRYDDALRTLKGVPQSATCSKQAAFLSALALAGRGDSELAAEQISALATPMLNGEGHTTTYRLFSEFTSRLLEQDKQDSAKALLNLTLSLEIPWQSKLTVARKLAALHHPPASTPLIAVLTEQLVRHPESTEDRVLLAPLIPSEGALKLLKDQPDTLNVLSTRVRVSTELWQRFRHLDTLRHHFPDDPITSELVFEVGQEAAERRLFDAALHLLGSLKNNPTYSQRASLALIRLTFSAHDPQFLTLTEAFLKDNALSTKAPFVKELQEQYLYTDALLHAHEGTYNEREFSAGRDEPSLALQEVFALLKLNNPLATTRLDEVIAHFPDSQQAVAAWRTKLSPTDSFEAGLISLKDAAERGEWAASIALDDLSQERLALSSEQSKVGKASVHLQVSGVDEVELKLHKIDVEGLARSGKGPADLKAMDVGIIPPDKRWAVTLPEHHKLETVNVDLPIKMPPGLYAITAATKTQEATTFLLISDLTLSTRVIGDEVVAAAFSDGQAVPNTTFLIVGANQTKSVRSDRTGLMRTTFSGGTNIILATSSKGVAFVRANTSQPVREEPVQMMVDLDRPTYLPGDTVSLRVVATKDSRALKGTYKITLWDRDQALFTKNVEADSFGAVNTTLSLPTLTANERLRYYSLKVTAPQQSAPKTLASIKVIRQQAPSPHLTVFHKNQEMSAKLVDGKGVPMPQQPITIYEETTNKSLKVKTDSSGVITYKPALPGLPTHAHFQAHRTPTTVRFESRPKEEPRTLTGSASAQQGGAFQITLNTTPGDYHYFWLKAHKATNPAPFLDPAVPPLNTSLRTLKEEPESAPVHWISTAERSITTKKWGEPLTYSNLEEGEYTLVVVDESGDQPTLFWNGTVGRATASTTTTDQIKQQTTVSVLERSALVTIEGRTLLSAKVIEAGESNTFAFENGWSGDLTAVTTSDSAQTAHRFSLASSLKVQTEINRDSSTWSISTQVSKPNGRPARAQLLLRIVDEELWQFGVARSIATSLFLPNTRHQGRSFFTNTLTDGALGRAISAALQQEFARQSMEKKRRASRNSSLNTGLLSIMDDEVPMESHAFGASGLGTRGTGLGGGGAGYGAGIARNASPLPGGIPQIHAQREAVAWQIVQTNNQGRAEFSLPAPDPKRPYRVEVIALGSNLVGSSTEVIEPGWAPYFAVDPIAPGWPGSVANPRLRLVNPTAVEQKVHVSINQKTEQFTLKPNAVLTHQLAEQPVGSKLVISMTSPLVHQNEPWNFALREGVLSNDGDIHGATNSLVPLVFAADPLSDQPNHAVIHAAALWAAVPYLTADDQKRAKKQVSQVVAMVRASPNRLSGRGVAVALTLLADTKRTFQVPHSALEALDEHLLARPPEKARERLDLAWARAVALDRVDEATLGRLIREVKRLSPDGQAKLNRLLIHLKRPTVAIADGDGPNHQLLRIKNPKRRSLTVAPPPLGHPDRPTWVQAFGALLSNEPGPAPLHTSATAGTLTWEMVPPTSYYNWKAQRLPVSWGHSPAVVQPTFNDSEAQCGATATTPCRVAIGEGVAVSGTFFGVAQGGLTPTSTGPNQTRLMATTAGTFRVWLNNQNTDEEGTWLHVVVTDSELSALGQPQRLARARFLISQDLDTGDLFSGLEALSDWDSRYRTEAAQVRFDLATEPQALIAAFEDLKDQQPEAVIALPRVAETAEAYTKIGRFDRALQVYQAGIGAAFLTEAASLADLEAEIGPLASIQSLRELAASYPPVSVVQDAQFALPDRLAQLADSLPASVIEKGISTVDVQILATRWNRDFLALYPKHRLADEAGTHYLMGLFDLDAYDRTQQAADLLINTYKDSPEQDQWHLIAALNQSAQGQIVQSERWFKMVERQEFPQEDGQLGFSDLQVDARYGLGRIAEAADRLDAARDYYRLAASNFPEASLSLSLLDQRHLSTKAMSTFTMSQPVSVDLKATNIKEVDVRVYAIDLQTLFLRESGLPNVQGIQIAGVRPTWTGTRQLNAGPYPEQIKMPLPLSGAGAWLVRVTAGDQQTASLVIRSGLTVNTVDSANTRRVAVRYQGRPLSDVNIRAAASGSIQASKTDIRGVAEVAQSAPVLAIFKNHYGLSDNVQPGQVYLPSAPAPSSPEKDVLRNRLKRRAKQRSEQYEFDYIGNERGDEVQLNKL